MRVWPITLCISATLLLSTNSTCSAPFNNGTTTNSPPDSWFSASINGNSYQCNFDIKISGSKISSDKQAIILSGTSYSPASELKKCHLGAGIHATKVAPRAGFISDINLGAGIYVSMIPISLNPMSFVALAAKIGSDENIINIEKFYRKSASRERMREEASPNMNPVISINGRYISLDLYNCGDGEPVDVVDIRNQSWIKIDKKSCDDLFTFEN